MFELGKGETSEVGKYLFRAANMWWMLANYVCIASRGQVPRDNRFMYMAHVYFGLSIVVAVRGVVGMFAVQRPLLMIVLF